jgi:hypothetical protein
VENEYKADGLRRLFAAVVVVAVAVVELEVVALSIRTS